MTKQVGDRQQDLTNPTHAAILGEELEQVGWGRGQQDLTNPTHAATLGEGLEQVGWLVPGRGGGGGGGSRT